MNDLELQEPDVGLTPHLAIGGITTDNIGELVDAGCRGVALSAAVCSSRNPGEVCRAMVEALPTS